MRTWIRVFGLLACCATVSLAADSLNFFKNYFVKGDAVVAGIGTRGTGNSGVATGSINTGSFPADADVVAAYLYWVTLEDASNNGANITFRGYSITGTPIATPPVPRWSGFTKAVVYRADAFAYLPFDPATFKALPGGSFSVTVKDSGVITTAPSTEGISLVIVYRSSTAAFRGISIYDGGYTLGRTSDTFSVNIGGFYQASSSSPSAKVSYIVADGQPSDATGTNTDSLFFNGNQIGAATNVFVGGANGGTGSFWDNPTFDVSAYVAGNASSATTTSPGGSDALTFAATVFSTTVQDSDGDGLLDVWETSGFTDMDGTFINLPAMGANPNAKDLFVELDWLDGSGHSHKPKQAALDIVTTAFANSGINAHFDVGQDVGKSPAYYTGGNLVGQESVIAPNGSAWKFLPGGFGYVKDGVPPSIPGNFSYNRRHIFHYSFWAHQRPNFTDGTPNKASGVADLPGADTMITLGLWTHDTAADNMVGTVQEQAGTLLHELGHNLGLHHGGNENVNCKPNYESVMNYLYQTHGLQTNSGAIAFDFSKETLPTLSEGNLNETLGLGTMLYRARYYAPLATGSLRRCDGTNGLIPIARIDTPYSSGPIDWNYNLSNSETSIPADINGDGASTSTLTGFKDWSSVDLQQISAGFAYSEGEIANGEIANGEIANGEIANGEIANGEIANGEIANGNEYSFDDAINTNPPAPGNSLVYRTATGQVRLGWNQVGLAIVRRYQIYRYKVGDPIPSAFTFVTASGNPPPASYTDTTAVPGTTYNYFVKSVDEYNNVSIQSSNTVTVLAK